MTISANFHFLKQHDVQLMRLSALAERYFREDPNACLIKLRQFGEVLAQLTAARSGLFVSAQEAQADLLRRLKNERILPREVADLFYQLRTVGNRATHEYSGTHSEALTILKIARQLGIWFHRTVSADRTFKPTPFVPPPDPVDATRELSQELARLQRALDASRSEAERAQIVAEEQARALLSAEEQARKAAEDRTIWEKLAQEAEEVRAALETELVALQAASKQAPQLITTIANAESAAAAVDLDEDATRAIIDQQLRDRGWQTDSKTLRYSLGTRPVKGQNLAIAEFPTASGPADYALFIGTQCIAVVEAKRQRKNVSAAIDQSERYARGIGVTKGFEAVGGAWEVFCVPFVFATNGRPYLKQLETESGIWFRDVRKSTNHRRALTGWFTPDGLKAELGMDRDVAQAALKTQPFVFGFPLRPYQARAIQAVEAALAVDTRALLVAMATGTGKTKLAIALLYRLLSAKRFRRVCFIVDRSALGTQASGEFRTTKVVSTKSFADIFGLQGLEGVTPESETKVHICTIQALVKRVLYAKEPSEVPPIDQYDLLLIDECHRGYLLDREMSDAELSFRDQADYISSYRRVLEHFDAVKIGLTATPALHTKEIFGDPVFKYSYREAVIDGYLIDHEPPIQITTALSQSGITFEAGKKIEVLDTSSGSVDLTNAPDEIHFDVEEFNRKVITVPFNRAVARELAKHIDPTLPGKTLMFAVSDAHADIVVAQVKQAMADLYGEIEDAAIRKITGSVDRVGDLIRSFRNDPLPKIAITVDLLTTGIDVPSILNLVFLRRVNSRILYEQMLGRATRQCEAIDKETFRIFDAVDLYRNLQQVTEMKPVVVTPTITLTQLFDELGQVQIEEHRRLVRDQILVKLRRCLRRISNPVRERYEAEIGETPETTLERLTTQPLTDVVAWVRQKPQLGQILDWNPHGGGGSILPISHHPDSVIAVSRGYGSGQKPEDYLDSFTAYIRSQINQITALIVVVQRPRELTRSQLRELRLELDKMGYSETSLRQAWQDARNEDIAASIVGFIRQAALGDPLIPYDERVRLAIRRTLSKQVWSDPQRKWLQRIGEQIAREVIVDRDSLDQEPFQSDGGFNRLNRIFEGQLEAILGDINEELWQKTA